LHQISQDLGIQLSYLMTYNNLNEDDPLPAGTMLQLQSTVKSGTSVLAAEEVEEAPPAPKVRYHKVRPNENLQSIAQKYRVTMAELKTWNNLRTSKIKAGQRIIVSKQTK
jgi:LysM repeat protein